MIFDLGKIVEVLGTARAIASVGLLIFAFSIATLILSLPWEQMGLDPEEADRLWREAMDDFLEVHSGPTKHNS